MTTTPNLSTTAASSSTLAVLSRLRALELQVGLLDIHHNNNNAIHDDEDPSGVVSSSSSSSKNTVMTRLEALEHQALNLWTTNTSSSSTSTASSPSGTTSTTTNNNSNNALHSMGLAWKETWLESERLLAELDPATALTHQQHSLTGSAAAVVAMAPILYRRQQVLCSAELLRHNMRLVSQILNLLLIGGSGGGSAAGQAAWSNTTSSTITNKSTRTTTSTGGGGSSSGGGGASGTGTTSQQQQKQQQQPLSQITEEQVVQAPILVLTTTTGDEENVERLTRVEQAALDLQARTQVVAARLDRLLTSYHSVVTTFSEQVVLLEEQVRQHENKKRRG